MKETLISNDQAKSFAIDCYDAIISEIKAEVEKQREVTTSDTTSIERYEQSTYIEQEE